MSIYASPIEVLQAALGRVGETITSLDDGSAPALIAKANYEGIIRAALAYRGHAWTFATDIVDLTKQATVTKGRWTAQYTYPTDKVLKVRNVMWPGGQRLRRDEYTLLGTKVLTVADAAYQATLLMRVNEGEWSDDFAEAVVTRLEALYLRALLERQQDARIRDKDADGMILTALVSDRRQAPVQTVEDSTLARAWRGNRVRGS